MKHIWKPQPKQLLFLSTPEFEALYGGAAGGGKSDALLIEALRQINHSAYRAIIFRKTFPQLSELIDRSIYLYKSAFPSAVYKESKHYWIFPSGAKIYFASMQYRKDRLNFQGKQYQFIAFDELTHFLEEEYVYMISRCRARAEGLRCYIRSTANPGGIGHGWVKARFIDIEPYKRFVQIIKINDKILHRDKIFIPATLFDNKILLENDPNYLANLAMLNNKDKNALLYGDWDSYEGQFFTEFKREIHVCKSFEIPKHWRRFRSLDYGMDMTACYWWAISENGKCFIYKEFCKEGLILSHAAKEIVARTNEDEIIDYTVASPDLWNKRQDTGKSGDDIFRENGILLREADNRRIPGWRMFREYLDYKDDGISKNSMLNIFQNCTELIRTLPLLLHDQTNVEDIASNPHELTHYAESVRYGIMSRPLNSNKFKAEKNTLQLLLDRKNKQNKFY